MKHSYDFVRYLPKELSVKIMKHVDDTCTFAEITAVSKIWRRFVLENKLCKQFCLDMYPELSKIVGIEETINRPEPCAIRTDMVGVPGFLVREHRVFSFLGAIIALYQVHCHPAESICASSTSKLPGQEYSSEEEGDDVNYPTPKFWCSKGQSDPTIPETVVYQLASNMLIISEIHVLFHKETFWHREPSYSAKSVRFSLGHKKSSRPLATQTFDDDLFTWTYISPEFEMTKKNGTLKFHLPKRVLCLGGVLKMELLGRVRKNCLDGLYYVCVRNIEAYGQSLMPEFGINMIDGTGKFNLKCSWPRIYCDDGSDFDSSDSNSSDPDE